MNKVVRTPLICPLVPALLLASQVALAQETPRADKHYIGLLATTYNHRTVGEKHQGNRLGHWRNPGVGWPYHRSVPRRAAGRRRFSKTPRFRTATSTLSIWLLRQLVHGPALPYHRLRQRLRPVKLPVTPERERSAIRRMTVTTPTLISTANFRIAVSASAGLPVSTSK